MKPSLQKLHKFLKLEAERNYDNKAVVGGLERMLEPWQADAQADGLSPALVQAVISRLRDYSALSPASRADALDGLWKRIQREMGSDLPSLPHAAPAAKVVAPVEARQPQKPPEQSKTPPPAHAPAAAPPHEPASAPVAPPTSKPGQPAALGASTTVLAGVGPRHGQTLTRLGLHTLGDMLYYFPRRYDDYTQLKPINRLWFGEEVTVIGTIQSITSRIIRGGRFQIAEAILTDGSGAMRITWFNQPWIVKRLQPETQVVVSGKVDQYLGRLTMNNPEWEPLEQQNLHTHRIVPVYSLTANITQRWLRRLMYDVVGYWSPRVSDPLPAAMLEEAQLTSLSNALLQIHFPESTKSLAAARQRIAFDEIFYLQLGVLRQKRAWHDRPARIYDTPQDWLETQIGSLPFALTNAQQRALADVRGDLASGHPMNRLLQGDVGSGKTVIAALGVAMVARHGAQSAFMAPTSILAEQHYQSMLRFLAEAHGETAPIMQPEEIRLLVGATSESEKRNIRQALEDGSIKLIIGTHALIEDPVIFDNLQFIIVDEQHRFGVEQRALLRAKGDNPHLLVMTATPIPRSLALTIYGDLDLSVMDEMPPGRQAIQTEVLFPRERERAYAFIDNQVRLGRQAFIIYSLVEESESTDAPAAVEEHARLQKEVFPRHQLGLLHGRMKADDKEAVMQQFRDGQFQILVSTSVVEVGVDVPNATVMLIDGANRFGLAQLHQFRGRVGRGEDQSYCLLIPDNPDEAENTRLTAMVETNDGFVLAERDLEQRGPGDFLGTMQSGYNGLRIANLIDVRLIEKARRHAQALFASDPDLSQAEHSLIAETLRRTWNPGQGDIS